VSSPPYSAGIQPDPRLRRGVLVSGALLLVAGVLLAATLPLTAAWRVLLAVTWCAFSGRELVATWRAYAGAGELRVEADGRLYCRARSGAWQPATFCAGSVVCARIAWLRIAIRQGPRYAELVCGDVRESEEWRRFQVIWRHIGAAL